MPRIHVFKGAGNDYGFTSDPDGNNLPADKATWHHVRDIDINRGDGTCLGVNSDYVLDAIERGDAYITTIRVLDTDKLLQK